MSLQHMSLLHIINCCMSLAIDDKDLHFHAGNLITLPKSIFSTSRVKAFFNGLVSPYKAMHMALKHLLKILF